MYYKLTSQKMRTYNSFQWQLNKWVKRGGKTKRLCTNSWLHCYNHPLLAVLLNPIHAGIKNPRLFRVNVRGKKLSGDLKFGFTQMRLIKELPVPEFTIIRRIAFSILCVKEVYRGKKWNEWADNWLSNKDRTNKTARAVSDAVWNVIGATRATRAASDTIYAAERAAYAAAIAIEGYPAIAVKGLAAARAIAANAVAYATYTTHIDLIKIAKQAMKFKEN